MATGENLELETNATHHWECQFVEDVLSLSSKPVFESPSPIIREMGEWHFSSPGKMLRSRLISRVGQVFAIPRPKILLWGAVCELIHNASLVHDDLQDGDTFRRDKKSIWAQFGKPQALNFGDYLLTQPYILIGQSREIQEQEKLNLILESAQCVTQITEGQCLDIQLQGNNNHEKSLETFLQITRQKTGKLFRSLVDGLALFIHDSAKRAKAHQVADLLENMGVLFQMVDDILDLYGNKGREKIGCDIYEGKFSFLVAMHLRANSEDQYSLFNILAKPREETTHEDVIWFRDKMQEKSTLSACLRHLDQSLKQIERQITALHDPNLAEVLQQFIEDLFKGLDRLNSPLSQREDSDHPVEC